MKDLIDAFWRAAAYCLLPRVILLSLVPLLLAAGLSIGLSYFFWEAAVDGVRATLEGWQLVAMMLDWLDNLGAQGFRTVLAPLVVVALSVPAIVVLSLLLVAWFMVPSLVKLVAQRRFPTLERKRGAGLWQSVLWSLVCTLLAGIAMLVSIPLWLIPPLVLVLPPLIWGWLTYRVMAFDAMADHASRDERHQLMREQRWPLLAMGVVSGYLGAAPSLLWAVSAATLVFAPVLVLLSVWIYTLVFAFSALWFAHFSLAVLERLRAQAPPVLVPTPSAVLPLASEDQIA